MNNPSLRQIGYSAARANNTPPGINRWRRSALIEDRLRQRLCSELRHITSCTAYLEPHLLAKYEREATVGINTSALKTFSLAEIGYDVSETLSIENMDIRSIDEDKQEKYDDVAFFDLIEILIIFCKSDQRNEVVKRFNNILDEENAQFKIQDWMITLSGRDALNNIAPLIKNRLLREKIEATRTGTSSTPLPAQARARNAADALQFIFSGDEKKDTKATSEQIVQNISKEWTQEGDVADLETILNDLVKITKEMNNKIGNIRHTDRNTITTDGATMFEMIYKINMAIIQLCLSSEPTKYIENRKADTVKKDYIEKYKIDISKYREIEMVDDTAIDLSMIPF